ncbi:NAD-dependent epimerase/dehydratase family protein [Arthrobacter sp. NPDC092385]|uniref:NAD-dependent epimerase/dehydratase family protein n=1 Tax=Arthrobacter sp. NPDC092385 TaxID=3363943 RepID=UPI003828D9D5
MSRYVVTGGSGRLGASVIEALAGAGHEVLSVDREASDGLAARQIIHDLRDAEATRDLFLELRPHGVVHLAAISVPFSAPDPVIFATNTGLAYNVIEATVAAGATQLLVASSPTVVGYGSPQGWAPQYLPLDEDHPITPWNGYAASKEAVEHLIAMAARAHGRAVDFGLFRPCFVIAPEEWDGAPTQQGHTVRERLEDPSLSAVALFNYVDARDAGDFVVAWTGRSYSVPNGSCFFVGAADALALGPMDTLLPEHVPNIGGLAAGLTGTAPVFSSDRAEQLLGWRARRSWRTELPQSTLAALGLSDPTTNGVSLA